MKKIQVNTMDKFKINFVATFQNKNWSGNFQTVPDLNLLKCITQHLYTIFQNLIRKFSKIQKN